MQNLTSIKQTQSRKFSTVEPSPTAPILQILSEKERLKPQFSNLQSINYENHFRLANVVQQILNMKPKTSHKKNGKNSKGMKTQANILFKPTPRFFQAKDKMHNIQSKQDENSEQNIREDTSINLKPNKINFISISNRLSLERVHKSQSSRAIKRQPQPLQCKFEEVIKNNEQIDDLNSINHIDSQQQGRNNKIRISKRRKDQTSFPKTKITINNIDSFAQISENKKQSSKVFKYNLNLAKPKSLHHIKQWNSQAQLTKDLRKNTKTAKIPQFIKATLSQYQNQPSYSLQQLYNKKINPNRELNNDNQDKISVRKEIVQCELDEVYKRLEDNYREHHVMANKIKLAMKERKKQIFTSQASKESTKNIKNSFEQDKVIEKKSIGKERKRINEQKMKICGWQEEEEEEEKNSPTLFSK